MLNWRDYLRRGGTVVKTILVILALIIFAVVSFLVIQSGYGIFAIIGAILIGLVIAVLLFFKAWRKYAMVDVLKDAFLKLHRGTRLGVFPYEIPLIVKQNEHATIEGFGGMVQGRTMLPLDKKLLDFMGEPKIVDRKAVNAENEIEDIEEDNVIWCFRVKQPHQIFGTKEVLVIVTDSQISPLSRDVTGDLQIGTPLLVYGHWIEIGRFMVLWNTGKQLEKCIAGIQTTAMLALLERHMIRLGQLAKMDAKTRPEIVERQEMGKSEADILGGDTK